MSSILYHPSPVLGLPPSQTTHSVSLSRSRSRSRPAACVPTRADPLPGVPPAPRDSLAPGHLTPNPRNVEALSTPSPDHRLASTITSFKETTGTPVSTAEPGTSRITELVLKSSNKGTDTVQASSKFASASSSSRAPAHTPRTRTRSRNQFQIPPIAIDADKMRFTSPDLARPALTPLGHRLLLLSEMKLYDLDTPAGGREAGSALWKEVLVRQAVKSAWASVDAGHVGEMTDWSSRGAKGLEVIGEEGEEEQEEEAAVEERKGERWLEELMATLGEEEYASVNERTAEWAESCVSDADWDDYEYDAEGMEVFTLPLPPSPRTPPTTPPAAPGLLEMETQLRCDPAFASAPLSPSLRPSSLPLSPETSVSTVEVSEVDDLDSDDDSLGSISPTPAIAYHALLDKTSKAYFQSVTPVQARDGRVPPPTPIPITNPLLPTDPLDTDDLDDCADDFLLPPPLHRSFSASSSSSDEVCQCVTPPLADCEELEEDARLDLRYDTKYGAGTGLGLTLGASYY